MENLAAQSIDYHMIELTQETGVMARIFQGLYRNAANATFSRTHIGHRAEEFLPMVINSIRVSARSNPAFQRRAHGR